MKRFLADKEKTVTAALFILEQLGGKSDFHKLFKLIYFADQKHLVKYGTPISGDRYIAMKHGPVPSEMYDILKSIRNGYESNSFLIKEVSYIVSAIQRPELDSLSKSEIECLTESIQENKDLDFNAIETKSHKSAWNKAQEQTDEISYIDIALEGGANEEMIKYIQITLDNQIAFNHYAIA